MFKPKNNGSILKFIFDSIISTDSLNNKFIFPFINCLSLLIFKFLIFNKLSFIVRLDCKKSILFPFISPKYLLISIFKLL